MAFFLTRHNHEIKISVTTLFLPGKYIRTMPPTHINFITLILLVFLASFALVPAASASDSAPAIPATVNFSAPKMEVSVFVNSIDNLDMIKGSYTVDCYLHFRWTDPGIKTANFEFMNGKPASGAESVKMIWENKSGPVMEEWYRARADFSSTPNNMDYPFHSGFLPITIEDADYESSQLTYVPLQEESGIEPEFGIPGWKFGTPTFSVRNHSYPGNTTYSQLTYNIPLTNDALASLLQTIVPP